MKYRLFFLSIVLLFLSAGLAFAQIYKWVDENGVTHYSDSSPQEISESENEENSMPVTPSAPSPPRRNSESAAGTTDLEEATNIIEAITEEQEESTAGNRPIVELYVTSWCGYCKKAKAFLRARGVAFTEYDVEKDLEAARRMRRLTPSRSVPFAVINGRQIQGFSEAAYASALNNL
jgi:glutaredoxin